ncbi:MAG: septum formation initiator family protein [Actinomycetota bacterium]|nr:septum formation initiator family protein [Actinomycetota bacterium]
MTETLERTTDAVPSRKQRWGWVLAVVLLGALALTVSGILPFRQLVSQQRQIERTQDQLAALEQENRMLSEDIEMLGTDTEIERIAREQYGLVRPGEVAYVVVTPRETSVVATAPDPVVRSDERSWWQRVWDFITGDDISSDG